jgi:hypothetical protein
MNRTISLPKLQEVIRARVCAFCEHLTHGGDKLPLNVERDCEHGCELFQSLPHLRTLAVHTDPVVGNFERAAKAACGVVTTHPLGREVLGTLRELTSA